MTTRIGIELSPTACRIVEIDAGPALRRHTRDARVLSFSVLPPSGPETQAKLASLRGRRAAVVVWDGSSDHRQVMVTRGSSETMRAEALVALGAAGVSTRGVWADIAPVAQPGDRGARRPVVVALASSAALRSALQPLLDAGIRVRTVMTPAVALDSLARLRHAFAVRGSIEAYVALEETVTAIALVRDGALLAARDLAWGYLDENVDGQQPRAREAIATRLADELSEFFAELGGSPGSAGGVGQMCVCGGLGELRSMTALLMERLDIEVETLDSLFGIDDRRLPDPADEFRERGAELRVAWAAATDWPPPINLLRARRRQVSRAMLRRAAVAAGVAAGLGLGWTVARMTDTKALARTVSKAPSLLARAVPSAVTTRAPVAAAKPTVAMRSPTVTAPPQPAAMKPSVPAAKPSVPMKTPFATAPPQALAMPSSVATAKATVSTKALEATSPSSPTAKPSVGAVRPAVVTEPPVVTAPLPEVVVMQSSAAAAKPTVSTRPIEVTSPVSPTAKPSLWAAKPTVVTKPLPVTAPQTAATASPSPATTANRPAIAPPTIVPRSTEPAAHATPPAADRPALELTPIVKPPVPSRVTRSTEVARSEPPAEAVNRARPAPEAERALPFDAALGTILYSPDRRLAIIDGRIVGLGDEVRGARIVDITPAGVSLRDAQGKLRRLSLGAGGR